MIEYIRCFLLLLVEWCRRSR